MNILSIIANNPALTQALRELLEKQFEAPTTMSEVSPDVDDKVLGQFLRARIAGLSAIRQAFNEINSYQQVEEKEAGANPAR